MSNCKLKAFDYANKQNTFYDEKNNEMLYGRSNLMGVLGVSDGTCNQINPLMLRYNGRCGLGAAGGNPCFQDSMEPFEQIDGCNVNNLVVFIFITLILLLIISIQYSENDVE